jgi:phosphoserine aminotransferase
VNVVATSEKETFSYIPKLDPKTFSKDADYFYIVTNNTIYGTEYKTIPETGDIPLIADMSSNILSAPIDVSKFGLIFAGAQKNIGPAGVALVIIREDLLERSPATIPSMLNYKIYAENKSLYNTPPCYSIYIAGLVFQWIKEQGGLAAMEKRNVAKAKILYDYLNQSKLFRSPVAKEDRSIMNVPFVTGDEKLDAKFTEEASKRGLKTLKGHRTVGGMRASIYNAMPMEGVKALVDFMKEFEKNNTK